MWFANNRSVIFDYINKKSVGRPREATHRHVKCNKTAYFKINYYGNQPEP